MSRSQADHHSLKRATIVSIALHLLAAPLIVVSAVPYADSSLFRGDTRNGETTHVAYLTIDRRPRASARAANSSAPRPSEPLHRRVVPKSHLGRAAAAAHSRRSANAKTVAATASNARANASARNAGRPSLELTLTTPAPERAAIPRAPAQSRATASSPARESAAPTTAPSPSATSAEAPSAAAQPQQVAARGVDVPPGGWGQTFEKPLVADESALADLRAKYRGTRVVTIEVDESGRATRIILSSVIPDDVRSELERHLLAMRYVPAECNGLRCSGTLQISL